MNLMQSVEVMLATHYAALQHGHRPYAIEQKSGPGIGKSDSKKLYASRLAAKIQSPVGYVRVVVGSYGSSADVRGFGMPQKADDGTLITKFARAPWYPAAHNTTIFYPVDDGKGGVAVIEMEDGDPETVAWIEENGVPAVGILDMDEFGQAEDDIKKACADVFLYGRCGETILPKGWRVVAASNRMKDRAGVARSLTFLVNRRCEHNIDPSVGAWAEWAEAQDDAHRPHYMTISFARKNANLVFRDAVPAGDAPFCTPRTLCMMDFELRALQTDDDRARNRLPTTPLAGEVCRGWIGEAEQAQYFTHLKYADELPDWDELVANPAKAKMPATKDAQMVAGYMCAYSVDDTSAKAMMTYMKRMMVEMQVLTMRAVMSQSEKHPERASAVLETPDASEWLATHKELLIASRS
jgi:hypothetical protein